MDSSKSGYSYFTDDGENLGIFLENLSNEDENSRKKLTLQRSLEVFNVSQVEKDGLNNFFVVEEDSGVDEFIGNNNLNPLNESLKSYFDIVQQEDKENEEDEFFIPKNNENVDNIVDESFGKILTFGKSPVSSSISQLDSSILNDFYSPEHDDDNPPNDDDDDDFLNDYKFIDSFSSLFNKKKSNNYSDDYLLDPRFNTSWKQSLRESIMNFDAIGRSRYPSAIENRHYKIVQLKETWEERRNLKSKNSFLHKRCKDIKSRLRIMSYFEKSSGFPSIILNDKYQSKLENFMETKNNVEEKENFYLDEIKNLDKKYQDFVEDFERINRELNLRELEVGTECWPKLSEKKIQFLLRKQEKRREPLVEIRKKFFKLRNYLESINEKIKSYDSIFGEGRTMTEYENLLASKNHKIDRLDDRDEDVLRVRKKLHWTVPILTQVKQTLECLNYDVEKISSEIHEIDEERQQKRSLILQATKQRDELRKINVKLQQVGFLLVNPRFMKMMNNSINELAILKIKVKEIEHLLSDNKLKIKVM